MKTKNILKFKGLTALYLVLATGAVQAATDRSDLNHQSKTFTLDSQGLKKFDADVIAGDLSIHGRSDVEQVLVKADIYFEDGQQDNISITLTEDNDAAKLLVNYEEEKGWFNQGDQYYVDLTVTIPNTMAVSVDDSSGDIVIRNIENNAAINDGSGNIEVEVKGDLAIDDGSGDILVGTGAGKVAISDGSGDIRIASAGSAAIDDGSGDIRIGSLASSAAINDGSGNIQIEQFVGGSINDSSGNINVTTSHGELAVNDGSGDINIGTNHGDLVISDSSGDIRIGDAKSSLKISDGSGDIHLSSLQGVTFLNTGSGEVFVNGKPMESVSKKRHKDYLK